MMETLNFNTTLLVCSEERNGPQRDNIYIVITITIIYVIIFLTGIIGNISTCVVISRNKAMHTATNYYLFSLAISDLLLIISGIPQEIYLNWYRYPYVFGSVFCFLRGLCAETSANATVLTITAFTVERYLAICHPFLSHTMSKLSRAIKLIFIIWLIAICLAIPPAMQFGIQIDEYGCVTCTLVKQIIPYSFEVSTMLFFIIPMTFITLLYILIGVRLKSSRMMKRRSANAKIQTKSSRKVVKMLVAVVIAFFICWAPFHAQRLYANIAMQRKHDNETHKKYIKIYEIVTYISGVLYYISATVNPILYNIMSVKFREAFKETFTKCCCCIRFNNMQHTRPERSYSMLSRSAQRGPDSLTDSGKEEQPTTNTHTTLTNKSSMDSYVVSASGGSGAAVSFTKRPKTTALRTTSSTASLPPPPPSPTTTTTTTTTTYLNVNLQQQPRKFNKFLQIFQCIAKRTFDEHNLNNKRFSVLYSSPIREQNYIFEMENIQQQQQQHNNKENHMKFSHKRSFDISNSSLKDVECMAIEDELTAYMKEIKERKIYCN